MKEEQGKFWLVISVYGIAADGGVARYGTYE